MFEEIAQNVHADFEMMVKGGCADLHMWQQVKDNVIVLVYCLCSLWSCIASSSYVAVTLCRAFLCVVVIVCSRCALLSSSGEANHCFLSKCLDKFVITN